MSLTGKIADKISKELGYNKDKSEVVAYGLFAVMQILASLILVTIFGLFFKIVFQALAFSFAANILRQYSGGIHASKPSICLVVGTVATILFAYLAHILAPVLSTGLTLFFQAATIIFSYYIVFRYSPVDSKAKPIKTHEKKKKMKKFSIYVLSLYLVFIIILTALFSMSNKNIYMEYSFVICFAVLWQSFNLTLIGHKVLGKVDVLFKMIFAQKKGDN